jgi:hypothetical protein
MCKMDKMTNSKKEQKKNMEKIKESLQIKAGNNKEIEFLLKRL